MDNVRSIGGEVRPSSRPGRKSSSSSRLRHLFCPFMGEVSCGRAMDSETEALLRTRLRGATTVFLISSLLFTVRSLILGDLPFGLRNAAVLAVLTASLAALMSRRHMSLLHLRGLELLVFATLSVHLVAISFDVTALLAARGEPVATLQSILRFLTPHVLVISAYGLLIPNTWRRAVVVVAVLAGWPLAYWAVQLRGNAALRAGLGDGFGVEEKSFIVLITLCASFLAVYGTHVVHAIRKMAAEAREMGLYRLTERIGVGGMGEVWKAEHQLLTRPAAIKLIRPEIGAAPDGSGSSVAAQRFQREAQATASLRSPHTIALYDFGTTRDGTFYYVMEYLNGLDLDKLIRQFGPLPAERAVFLLEQAARSLAEAHGVGLIHRDVKPSNLHVCVMGIEHDFLKVLDFGLVKNTTVADGDGITLTSEQSTTGTPAFMPPEMALGNRPVDERTDIYALGCVAYWMLTGQLVFESKTSLEMIVDHVKTAPIAPTSRTDNPIPEELSALILSCLEKEPERRPQDMLQLSSRLSGLALSNPWTRQRAADWWQVNAPAAEQLNVA